MPIDRAALAAGSIRLASGISFLVDPLRANRLWGDSKEPTPSGLLLLHSMGYRDALIGGLLTAAALRGKDTRNRRRSLWQDLPVPAAILRGAGAMPCQGIEGNGRDT